MKKRKEGTLERVDFAGRKENGKAVGDSFEGAIKGVKQVSFVGLPDFLAKARELIASVDAAPHRMRYQRAKSLARDLRSIERAMKGGVDEAALYAAVGAALTYAALANAMRDDDAAYKRKKKISVGAVLATENRWLSQKKRRPVAKEIAGELGVASQSIDRVFRRDIVDVDE